MINILVTGGAGFFGYHLVKKLSSLYGGRCKVIVLDDLSNSKIRSSLEYGRMRSAFSFYKEDIRNLDAVSSIIKRETIDTCVHLAARTSIPNSIANPIETIDVNIRGTANMLEACLKNNVSSFIFASSAAVYGEPITLPLSEMHPLEPLSPYAASKVAGEALVSSYRNLRKIKALSLRFFNVYNPGQIANDAEVIAKFAWLLSKGIPPTIYGDGNQTRDFISVNDAINCIILAIEAQRQEEGTASKIPSAESSDSLLPFSAYNVGTGVPTSINDLAKKMIKISGLNLEPIYQYSEDEGKIKHSHADMGRTRKYLKFNAVDQLEPSLGQILLHRFFKNRFNQLAGYYP
jgi:UDP-glucose 4-epimerase